MENICTICRDPQTVLEFLRKVDYTLPVPLSARVDLEKFARSSAEGLVYGICRDGQLESAALVIYGYLNKPFAYLNLLATVPGCEGKGYAGILLKTVACVLVSRVCADLCRDGGSHALAGMAELAGAVAVLVIALPLFRAVAELLLGLMGGGI